MLAAPLSPERFAGLMARLGPFERAPHLAVAVSGGPDSLALTLLLAEWAHSRNGRVDALTVDHRLRAESTTEAEQVGRWLASLPGVTHRILAWSGPKPDSGIQAAAREARYRLLSAYCRDHAILHLCVAHHRDDQAETHRLRAGHGSGTIGLAGMSAVRPLDGVRLLRPLLGVGKAELLALLAAREQPWISDPSNSNPAFERVRLRATAEVETPAQDIAALHRLGLERQRLENAAASILAERLLVHPTGWAELALDAFPETASAGLAFGWVLQSLGGNDYPVSEERRLEALARIRAEAAADFTLGGCHLRRQGARLEIHRDWGAIRHRISPDAETNAPGMHLLWMVASMSRSRPNYRPTRASRSRDWASVGSENWAGSGIPRPATASPNRHARRSRPCGRATGWSRRRTWASAPA